MTRLVGVFHDAAPAGPVAAGREVAVSQVILALGSLCREHEVALFCDPRARDAAAAGMADLPRVRVEDRLRLLREPGAFDPGAWFEPQLDLHRPFALRERLGGRWPVTVLHHALSYPHLLHDAFLRLLLADTRPYDAFLCESVAARESLRAIVDHVRERLAARHGLETVFPGRYELVPVGVDVDRFRPLDPRESRERFGLDPEAFVLLWVGRLSPIDKADLLPLVRAFAELRGRRSEPLVLVCAGTQRPGERFGDVIAGYARDCGAGDAVRVITERETIVAWLPQLYAAADVFVSPADNVQEIFGLTPVEAMACGVPQVVSDWDGNRDTVVDGETGFLVPTRWAPCTADLEAESLLADPAYDHLAMAQAVAVDMAALVAAVERLLDDPGLRARLGAASRARAERVFAWPRIVARYEALWRELRAEAAAAPPPPSRSPGYDAPDYARFFAAYPSHPLAGSEPLALTAAGRELLGGAGLPSHYNATWRYLDLDLLRRVLAGFARLEGQGAPFTLERAADVLGGGDPSRRAVAARHVLWLLKYGYVALAESSRSQ